MLDSELVEKEKNLLEAVKLSKEQNDDSLILKLTDLASFYRIEKQIEKLVAVVEERHSVKIQKGDGPSSDLLGLASDLAENGQIDRALAILDRAKSEYDSQGIRDDELERDILLSTKISILVSNKREDEAIPLLQLKVASAFKNKAQYSDYWDSHLQLADLLQFHRKELGSALIEREKLHAFFTKFLSNDGTLTFHGFTVYFNNCDGLGILYRELNQPEKASLLYLELAAQMERSPFIGPTRIDIPSLIILAAEIEDNRGEKTTSKKLAKRAMELMTRFKHDNESLINRATAIIVRE